MQTSLRKAADFPLGDYSNRVAISAGKGSLSFGKGIARLVGTSLRTPMDVTLGVAQGFHNAPRIYGDETVRQPENITGFKSGLAAAGKSFSNGFYDGFSGLVMQPVNGAKDEGVAGFFKGFAKGLGGIALKPSAAVVGLPAYTFKGIYEEFRKRKETTVNEFIASTRIVQGLEELKACTEEEYREVMRQWERRFGKGVEDLAGPTESGVIDATELGSGAS